MFFKGCMAVLCLLVVTGCSTKDYALFQDESVDRQVSAKETSLLKYAFPPKDSSAYTSCDTLKEIKLPFHYESKILPGDSLRIDFYNNSRRIRVDDVDASTLLSKNSASFQSVSQKPEKEEYMVDVDGMVYLPLTHDTRLASMTETEASAYLTEKYKNYLTNPKVKVHIANTRIYVLGEVQKKGVLPVSRSGISLYEVIAKSGGLTDYANRKSIKVISGALGSQKMRFIDMTSLSALNSTNLMIPPNSVVYIPPRGAKGIKVAIDDYMPVLRLISTTLSAYLSYEYIVNGRD